MKWRRKETIAAGKDWIKLEVDAKALRAGREIEKWFLQNEKTKANISNHVNEKMHAEIFQSTRGFKNSHEGTTVGLATWLGAEEYYATLVSSHWSTSLTVIAIAPWQQQHSLTHSLTHSLSFFLYLSIYPSLSVSLSSVYLCFSLSSVYLCFSLSYPCSLTLSIDISVFVCRYLYLEFVIMTFEWRQLSSFGDQIICIWYFKDCFR